MTARERWEKASRAASFLSRAADARTTTQAGWLIEDAAMLLCEAGLCDLADAVHEAGFSDADIYLLHVRASQYAAELYTEAERRDEP